MKLMIGGHSQAVGSTVRGAMILGAALSLLGILPGVAHAGQVTGVAVANGSPSSAAGARTDYTVTFATSSIGGLSVTAGSQITIAFPEGTQFEGSVSATVTDTTTHQQVGYSYCSVLETTVTCEIAGTVAAGNTLAVELDRITNPSSANSNATLEVWTTSDTTHATSNPYQITPTSQVTQPTVSDTTSTAGALAAYKITFATSATGGLSATAASQITIAFPQGTELQGSVPATLTDTTTHQQVGYSYCSAIETFVTCVLAGTVAPGNTLVLELGRITNPPTPNDSTTLEVSTSSDTALTPSHPYPITPAAQPGTPNVTNSSPSSAASARTDYTVTFATSPTGGLSGTAGSQIMIALPQGTELPGSVSATITDATTHQQVANSNCSVLETTVTCEITGTVAAGNTLAVELDRITNPTTPNSNATLEVWSTSDTTHATSNPYQVTPASQVTQPTVTNGSPSAAPGALTDYAIAFATSATGGLSANAGSQITIVLPPGTGVGSFSNSVVTDDTSGQQVGYCTPERTTMTCSVYYSTVAAGDSLTVQLDGIVNPTATAPETVKVSTTSDTLAAASAPYGVGAPIVVTGTASNVSQTTAFVTGTVNPDATAVTGCNFEWGSSTSYGQSVSCSQIAGSGSNAEPVTSALTGLTPNTTYHFRVVATNAGGTSYGNDQAFSTLASTLPTSTPSVFASAPATASSEGAAFSGIVDPAGLTTTAYFEYGLDPKYSNGGSVVYDQRTPAQAVGSDFSGHSVSASVTGLVPAALYHVRLVAANGAGTTVGPDQTFTTAPSTAPPAPTLGRTVNVKPVEGLVLVKFPSGSPARASAASLAHDALSKGKGFIPLTETRQLPVGTEIDARQGTLDLVVAAIRRRHTHSAKLSGGLFTLSQQRTGLHKGLTTLALDEGLFPGAPSYEECGSAQASAIDPQARAAKLSTHVLQRLDATDDHGSFRTRGRYSSATVRGTSWSTADRCDGTLTVVHRGTVNVLDFATRRTISLNAGQSFLASAP